jgi:uncharacterized membrane protein HdeD (DUF308 family)
VRRLDASFIVLVGIQAVHSVEECLGGLYEVFPPARFVSELLSQDPQRGFIIGNVALVTFGLWCFVWPVRRRWRSAMAIGWFWVTIEMVNGVVHPLWSLREMSYTPGVATAPLLLAAALYLARELRAAQVQADSSIERGP